MQTEEKGQRPEAQERMRKLYSNKPINSEKIIFITINGSVYVKTSEKIARTRLKLEVDKKRTNMRLCRYFNDRKK